MSRFEQRARRDLQDPEVAAGYWEADAELRLIEAVDTLRKQQNLTTEEVARRMGRHREAVSRLLNTPYPNPRLDTLSGLFAALGVTAEIHLRRAREDEPPITVAIDIAEQTPA